MVLACKRYGFATPKKSFSQQQEYQRITTPPILSSAPTTFFRKPPPRAPQILHSAPRPAKTATAVEEAYTLPSLRLTLLPTEIVTPVEATYTKPNLASHHHYSIKLSPAEAPRTQPSVHSSKRNEYKQQRKTKTIPGAKYPFCPTTPSFFSTRRARPAPPSASVPKRKHPSKPSFGRPEGMSSYKLMSLRHNTAESYAERFTSARQAPCPP